MEDSIPRTIAGALVSIADKLDTLRGCFRVGLIPSGSKDPFALRRAAQGIVKILVEAKLRLPIQTLCEGNIQLEEFIAERIRYYFRELRGFKYDEVNAVLSSGWDDLLDVEERLEAVRDVRPTENFEPLAASFKRIRNILKQAQFEGLGDSLQDRLLESGPERELFEAFEVTRLACKVLTDYRSRLETVASLRPKVDLFFDKVLVNAPDPAVRQNRLTLLAPSAGLEFSTIADFSGNRNQRTRNQGNNQMSTKYVYSFGGGSAEGDGTMKDTLGGKGAGLAEMSRAGLPVPPGFTIATDVCNIYFNNNNRVPEDIQKEIDAAVVKLEKQMGKKLGDASDPLLLSVRSGAKFSMPGMIKNTILNLGLNDKTTAGLAAKSGNERFAWDCYRRFIQMFSEVALDVPMEKFDHIFDARKAKVKAKLDTGLNAEDLKVVIVDYKKVVEKETGKPFPQDPVEQLSMSRDAVFRSWWTPKAIYYRKMEKIPDDIGTAANVQTMVFGNMGDTSGTGVGFTRDPGSGDKVFYGEFLMNAQGEDVVAGIRTPHPIADLKQVLPQRLHPASPGSPRTSKNTIRTCRISSSPSRKASSTCFRPATGKRTGHAAVRIAVADGGRGDDLEERRHPARRSFSARSVAAPGLRSEDV